MEIRLTVQPLENREIWVCTELIAVDLRVGLPRQHLVVARIRERKTIADMDDAPFCLVAKDLALLRDRSPKERHQRLPALHRIVAPELFPQIYRVCPDATVLLVHQRPVGTREHLFPAQAI